MFYTKTILNWLDGSWNYVQIMNLYYHGYFKLCHFKAALNVIVDCNKRMTYCIWFILAVFGVSKATTVASKVNGKF
jgi:hypothetical protein